MAFSLMSTVCLVEILTTASMTCSATSAIASGPRAAAGTVSAGQTIAAASKTAAAGRRTGVVSEEKSAPMGVKCSWKRGLSQSGPVFKAIQGQTARFGNQISDGQAASLIADDLDPVIRVTSQTTTSPTSAETSPIVRRVASGVSSTLIHRPLGLARKGREHQALDHEDQPERGQEVGHADSRRRQRDAEGAPAAGAPAGGGSAGLPAPWPLPEGWLK